MIILLSKSLLSRTVKNLSIEIQNKQKLKSTSPSPLLPASTPIDISSSPAATEVATETQSSPVATDSISDQR
jgi:hypothetical protein